MGLIPKKIHFCWFGGKPLPPIVEECITSWRFFCPEYKIFEWNESNFDIRACPYVEQAYEAGMYAFVSDFARIKILFEHGGIYMDTDVELLKNLDPLLANKAFMGFEAGLGVNSGLIAGSIPKLPIIGELINEYQGLDFIKRKGEYNLTTCVHYQTALLEKHGLLRENRLQIVADITIYPIKYFSPMNHFTGIINIEEETYSIHKYEGTWAPETGRQGNKLKWRYVRKYGVFWGSLLRLFPYILYILRIDGIKGLFNKVMIVLKR